MSRDAVGLAACLLSYTIASSTFSPVVHAQTPAPAPQSPAQAPIPAGPAQPAAPAASAPSPATPATPATPAEPTPEKKEAARVAYARGQSAFAAGQYESARMAFEAAYAAVPNPIVLLSIAEAQVKLGQVPEAIAVLERYLELQPTAANRAEVEGKISTLSATPAIVTVTSEPAGAVLTVDGVESAQRTPAQLELRAGQHLLQYSMPGHLAGHETLVVEPGTRHELAIVLQAAPAGAVQPQPEAAAPPPAPAPPAEPPTTALWITGGIGAAGIITGTVLGFLALKEQSDYESNPSESGADRGERLALFADVGFGIGVMGLATAAVLLLTQDDVQTRDAPAKDSARLQWIPQLSPESVTATARMKF